ncbi:DUF6233 domain-containing protein [Streptomyces canus]|uniref:DUF6233 domain-containing protein n=1 Tax=Streptomyces canus TaxID=58343 RepID=UPI0030E0607A
MWHALWLNRIDRKIALLERREAEAEHGRKSLPRPPEWVVEVGTGTSKPPVQVHAGTCHMIGSRRRPVSRDEARRLLAEGLRACTHCQPDAQLHIIDLAAREATCAPSTTSPAPPRRLLTPAATPPAARPGAAAPVGPRPAPREPAGAGRPTGARQWQPACLADTNRDNLDRKVRLSSWGVPPRPPRSAGHRAVWHGRSVTPDRNARILINARLSSEQRSVAAASEAKRGSVRRGTQADGTCDGRHGARQSA